MHFKVEANPNLIERFDRVLDMEIADTAVKTEKKATT